VVVAEPGPLGVQRHDERVRVLKLEQDPFRTRAAGQQVGQLTVDPVHQAGAHQQVLDIARLAFEHFSDQVLGDRTVAAGKLRYEPLRIRVTDQGDDR
jgi:hypothetical protein